MTYQNSLGIFSCSLVPDKKLSFSSNIYLLSLLLDQIYPGQSFHIQSEIKDLLKMESIRTDHVYTSGNISSQINNLVSNRDKVIKTKKKHAQNFWLDSYRETWKTSLSISRSWSDDLPNFLRVVFVILCTYAFLFNFFHA